VCCAKEYQKYGIEISDLINVGCIGLIESINKFDLAKNLKLITYSVWWIKSRLIEYIRENENIVSIPFNQQDELQKLNKLKDELEAEYGGEIGYDQAVERLLVIEETKEFDKKVNDSLQRVVSLVEVNDEIIELVEIAPFFYKLSENVCLFVEEVEEMDDIPVPLRTLDNTPKTMDEYYKYVRPSIQAKYDSVSLDSSMDNEEGESKRSDFVQDKSSNFIERIEREDQNKVLHQAVRTLPHLNQRILTLFFGLEDGIQRTNEDISEILGLTSERIRQLKNSSLLTLSTNRPLLSTL
jgi:RNA polymerase sigma factor (sigma-70 family)